MMWSFRHELGRKGLHVSILVVLLGYYFLAEQTTKQIALLGLVGLLVIFLVMEFLRIELGMSLPVIERFIRPKEQTRMYGAIYLLSATIICLAVFDFRISLAALLMTTFGDMGAALIGKRFGRTLIFKNKTVSGTTAELVINLAVGFTVLTNIYIIIAMAFVATAVESFMDELDDNLYVPLFAGLVGQLMLMVL